MIENLAHDIYNTVSVKLAGMRANLKLRDAMARSRGGKLPTIKELHDKINGTRIKAISGLRDGEVIEDFKRGLSDRVSGKGFRWKPDFQVSPNGGEFQEDIEDLTKRIYRSARESYRERLRPAASNINKAHTMPEWEDSIQYKRLKNLESKIPIQKIKGYKDYDSIPKELLETLQNTSNAFTDYYYNTFNPTSERFNYRNLSGQQYSNSYSKGYYNPRSVPELNRVIDDLIATNDNYMFASHPRAMGRSKFRDTYKNIYDQYKTQLNNNSQKFLTGEGLDIHGMSLNKAIDRYGGSVENALFKGGDTGVDAKSMHSPDPEAAARRVKSISQAVAGEPGTGNVLSDLEKGNNGRNFGEGPYYNRENNQMFLSDIPQLALNYALNGKRDLAAVPFAIGNGKLIRALSHADAISNSPTRYSAETIKNLTATHPHFATIDLDEIARRFNEAAKANQSIEEYSKNMVFNGQRRSPNDPSFSQFYETQVPSRTLNSPNAYTRGVLVGRNLNPDTLGNIQNVNSATVNGVNQYKQILQEELNKGSRDYAFFLPEEIQKYTNAAETVDVSLRGVNAMRNMGGRGSFIDYLNNVVTPTYIKDRGQDNTLIPKNWLDGLDSDLTVSDIKNFENLESRFDMNDWKGNPLPSRVDLSRILDFADIDW